MNKAWMVLALTLTAGVAQAQDDAGEPAAESLLANGLTESEEKKLRVARGHGTAGIVVGALALGAGGTALSGAILPVVAAHPG